MGSEAQAGSAAIRVERLPFEREKAMDYRDRHVVVTGGTGALGSAVVSALIEAGAVCHVPFIDTAEAGRYGLRDHARVKLVGDIELSDQAAVTSFYSDLPRLWASIHLAGGFAMSPVAETNKSDLMKQVDMNFVSAFLCCAAAVRNMRQGAAGGRIINVATRPAVEWRLGAGMAAYAASKAAVAALTVALAQEVVGDGILVNAIAPATMDTPANRAAMPNADHATWAKVEDVAATVLFLASPDNRVTRGAVVPVFGRS
jgi:NAD(P)-dependent dehydrogenase (short-subunit alcohol dehydrogenase family)